MPTKKDRTRVTQPQGLNPLGTTRPVRNKPNQRAATDIPIEVPAYITYDRHTNGAGLQGWAINLDLFTFDTKVTVKIIRKPHKVVVMADGKEVFKSTKAGKRISAKPPLTTPEPEDTDVEHFV